MTDLMPKPNEPIAGPGGLITRSWRDYLRRFAAATSLAEVWAAIEEIRAQLADSGAGSFLPSTTQVSGRNSVQTFGTLADGVVLVQLQADQLNPAASSYYGTDVDGARGYHDHALATLSDVDLTGASSGDALVFDGDEWVPGSGIASAPFNYITADGDIYVTEDGTDLYIGI